MTIVLLCAGEVGLRAFEVLLKFKWLTISAVFSYEVDPQDKDFEDIRKLALENKIRFYQDQHVERIQYEGVWNSGNIDYILAIKWRRLIQPHTLSKINRELIIFHASLLPKYRGFAPINWPIINGELRSGVTMLYGAEEMDAGDIIDQHTFDISFNDSAASIDQKVIDGVCLLIGNNLPKLNNNTAKRTRQNHDDATYAIWRRPEDGKIDWSASAVSIYNLIRGLTKPYPGAFTFYNGSKLFVWSAVVERTQRHYLGIIPGRVERVIPGVGVNVLTGDGIIRLVDVSVDNSPVKNAADIIKNLKVQFE